MPRERELQRFGCASAAVLPSAIELAVDVLQDSDILPFGPNARRIAAVVLNGLAACHDECSLARLPERIARRVGNFRVLAALRPAVVGQAVPRAVMRRLQQVVGQRCRLVLVARPKSLPDRDFSITTGEAPWPAPTQHSPKAAASASFSNRTGTPKRSESGLTMSQRSQPVRVNGLLMSPWMGSTGPAQPMPMPAMGWVPV